MKHRDIFTLQDALAMLAEETGREWTRQDFFERVVEHAFPIWATTPVSARIVIHSGGHDHYAGYPASGRRFALLLMPHVRDLWLHGEAITSHPAWEPGDPEHQPRAAILAARERLDRSQYTRETWPHDNWDDGPYMGESEVCVFADGVTVTDQTCRVPRATMDELVRLPEAPTTTPEPLSATSVAVPIHQRGITKDQVLIAFAHLVSINLRKRLSDAKGLYGDKGARVQRGTKGGLHKSLWNPVQLAVGLRENNSAARHMLNNAFQEHLFLQDWWLEWKDIYPDLG